MLLHDREELDNHFGGRPDEDLALPCLFGIVDGIEAVVEDGCADHDGGGGGELVGLDGREGGGDSHWQACERGISGPG